MTILSGRFWIKHRVQKQIEGYGLGSGNSIPGYVPVEGFTAMINAVKK